MTEWRLSGLLTVNIRMKNWKFYLNCFNVFSCSSINNSYKENCLTILKQFSINWLILNNYYDLTDNIRVGYLKIQSPKYVYKILQQMFLLINIFTLLPTSTSRVGSRILYRLLKDTLYTKFINGKTKFNKW